MINSIFLLVLGRPKRNIVNRRNYNSNNFNLISRQHILVAPGAWRNLAYKHSFSSQYSRKCVQRQGPRWNRRKREKPTRIFIEELCDECTREAETSGAPGTSLRQASPFPLGPSPPRRTTERHTLLCCA